MNTLEQIKANWTKTDEIVYKTPDIKLKSLEEAKTKVIAKN
jgi:hypothetical protein